MFRLLFLLFPLGVACFAAKPTDYSTDIVVLDGGKVVQTMKLYVSGQSYSTDIPVTANAWQSRLGGDADLYVTVLDARTMVMPYSTYFGGVAEELGAITSMGNDLVVAHGLTGSSNFPLTGQAWRTSTAGPMKPFFSILDIRNPKASQLVYSTYIDLDMPLSVDDQGNVYLFGETRSPTYPVTAGAFQTQSPGTPAFVLTRLQPRSAETAAAQWTRNTYESEEQQR